MCVCECVCVCVCVCVYLYMSFLKKGYRITESNKNIYV